MKKIFIFFLLILASCSSNELQINMNNDFLFSEKMSFKEFKEKVRNYTEQSSYPNIDN